MNGTKRVITGAALIAVGVVVGVYISTNPFREARTAAELSIIYLR